MRQDLALVSQTSVDFEDSKAHVTTRKNAVLPLLDTEFSSAVQCSEMKTLYCSKRDLGWSAEMAQ